MHFEILTEEHGARPRPVPMEGIHRTLAEDEIRHFLRKKTCSAVVYIPSFDPSEAQCEAFALRTTQIPPFYFRYTNQKDIVAKKVIDYLRLTAGESQSDGSLDGIEQFEALFVKRYNLFHSLTGGVEYHCAIRNHFWPLDCIWHFDRHIRESSSNKLRMVWAVGREEGTAYTPTSNVIQPAFQRIMASNSEFLAKTRKLAANGIGAAIEYVSESEQFVELLADQNRVLLKDPDYYCQSPGDSICFHKMGMPSVDENVGAFHQASIKNMSRPGLQVIISEV